jgi:hypothetical protein
MRNLISKIDWKKVLKYGSCVVTGIVACASAISEEKQASKIVELETRLHNLESK